MTDEQMASEELAPSQQPAEKMLPQSEVNSLIGRAKQEAQERARRQMEQELQERMAQMQAPQDQAQQQEQPNQVDVDRAYQEIQERFTKEMQQKQLEEQMTQIANNYQNQITEGGKNYEDFNDVVKEFNPAEFPELVILATQAGNAADIVYELSKNPQKLATIDYLAQRSPQKAQAELARIGQSIAANRAAQAEEAQAQSSEPLDRLQPTNKNGSNGQMSVSDLRNQPWLRG